MVFKDGFNTRIRSAKKVANFSSLVGIWFVIWGPTYRPIEPHLAGWSELKKVTQSIANIASLNLKDVFLSTFQSLVIQK